MTSGPPITIERMGLEDLGDVLVIDRASFPTPWSHRQFHDALIRNPAARCRTARCLVARMAGRIAGFLLFETVGATAVHVVHLATHPDLRRRGVARALLGVVIEEARQRGVGRVYLRVRAANSAARALYEYLGFQAIKQHTYPDGGAGLEMSLELARAVVPTPSTGGEAA